MAAKQSHWAKPKPLSFQSKLPENFKVDFQAGERVGALEALYSPYFGVQRPPLSQILKIHLRGRKMPLGAVLSVENCKIWLG